MAISARSAACPPALRLTWDPTAGFGIWCDTGRGYPDNIAPASRAIKLAEHWDENTLLGSLIVGGFKHKIITDVIVGGEWKTASIPGTLCDSHHIIAVLDDVRSLAEDGQVLPSWAQHEWIILDHIDSAITHLVQRGHVFPNVHRIDGMAHAVWEPIASVDTDAWIEQLQRVITPNFMQPKRVKECIYQLVNARCVQLINRHEISTKSELATALHRGTPLVSTPITIAADLSSMAAGISCDTVDIVARIVEPSSPDFPLSEVDTDEMLLWAVQFLVRSGEGRLSSIDEELGTSSLRASIAAVIYKAIDESDQLSAGLICSNGTDRLLVSSSVHALVAAGAPSLHKHGIELMIPRTWTKVSPVVTAVVKPQEDDDSGGIGLGSLGSFSWKVSVGEHDLSERELHELANAASELVNIRGQWVIADSQALKKAAAFLAKNRGTGRGFGAYIAALVSEDADGVEVAAPHDARLNPSGAPHHGDIEFARTFTATLRPYQQHGMVWLESMRQAGIGAVLADDMGLGKTIQIIAMLCCRQPTGRPTLIVVPVSLLRNWVLECSTFAPTLSVYTHYGPQRLSAEEATHEFLRHDIVLTSYAIADRDVQLLREVQWEQLIIDEAQTIKNTGTDKARALRSIPSAHRIALTGTPVENKLEEFRAIIDFVQPHILGSASEFRHRFALPIQARDDEAAMSRFLAVTAPFVLRREKTDTSIITDLPDKILRTWDTHLTPEQASLYEEILCQLELTLKESGGNTSQSEKKGALLASLTALKQVCNHPALYLADGSPLRDAHGYRSRKFDALDTILDSCDSRGDRALIFTQYRGFGDMLVEYAQTRYGTKIPFLHGGVSQAARADMVAHFQEEDGPKVFVISLKAGGTGLTLTRANHIIHADRWWNPAVENQASDRAFRIGQQKNVTVHTLVSPGTIEQRIDDMLDAKSMLASSTIGTLASTLAAMQPDELMDFLSLGARA